MASVVIEEQVRIPLGLADLGDFRRWAQSDDFPQRGRIDYIGGDIEVDMSPEDLFSHGTLKGELYATLLARVKQLDLGHLFTDSTRVSNVGADLSVEPDIVLVTHAAIDNGRVRLVPKSTGQADRFVELEGSPDLVVEVVSDSSVQKDTQRLTSAYHKAGVPEYWIVDARKGELVFQIQRWADNRYDLAEPDNDGFQGSQVLSCRFKLDRIRDKRNYWRYELASRDL